MWRDENYAKRLKSMAIHSINSFSFLVDLHKLYFYKNTG